MVGGAALLFVFDAFALIGGHGRKLAVPGVAVLVGDGGESVVVLVTVNMLQLLLGKLLWRKGNRRERNFFLAVADGIGIKGESSWFHKGTFAALQGQPAPFELLVIFEA